MTLRHFTIFISVCDNKGMTNAAKDLHMSQPSVSQAIRELEVHYEVKLFERLGKKLYVTEAGRELLRYARHIVSLTQQTNFAMRGFAGGFHLRIGASLTVGESVMINLLASMKKDNPDIQLMSQIHNTAVLEDMILRDKLDVALVEGNISSEYIFEKKFMDDELAVVCGRVHLKDSEFMKKVLNCSPIDLDDDPDAIIPEFIANNNSLESLPYILREDGSGTRMLFEQELGANSMKPNVVGVFNNSQSVKLAVKAGLGFTAISKRLIQLELANRELFVIKTPGLRLKRTFRMIYHENKFITPQMKQLQAYLGI